MRDRASLIADGRMLFEGVLEPAKWINVASSTSVNRVARFMDHYWEMPKPGRPPLGRA